MRTVEEHLSAVLTQVHPLEPFAISLLESRGCVIAEDVTAPWPLPAFDAAAVDGYAVIVNDIAVASPSNPVQLSVIADIEAGQRPTKGLYPGAVIAVSAGAILPENTEAVISREHTEQVGNIVTVLQPATFGQFVRRKAEDVSIGEVVVTAGATVDARVLGLLAAVGRQNVEARPRPRVVVVSVGSELQEPGATLEPGRVPDSNGVMLAAAVAESGGVSYRVGPVASDADKLSTIVEDQLVRADLVLITGGISATSYDTIQAALSTLGDVDFHRIAMTPGSAQGFGFLGDDNIPVMVLPGNPVAAYISFEVFVRPVLRQLLGLPEKTSPLVRAKLDGTISVTKDRRHFIRATREIGRGGTHLVKPLDEQGAHLVAGLARTECLIVVPEMVGDVASGSEVDVLLLADSALW
jgi:molybdopterin molybdotransferase